MDSLQATNVCNDLLVAEDEEQVWGRSSSADDSASDIPIFKGDSSKKHPLQTVVHGLCQFRPGYFECDMVWQTNIPIHNRLRTLNVAGGQSKGLRAAQTVLAKFKVENRKNLFVFKETRTSSVFYFR